MPRLATEELSEHLAGVFDGMSNTIAGGKRQPLGQRALRFEEINQLPDMNSEIDHIWYGRPDVAGAPSQDPNQAQDLGFELTKNREGSLKWGGHANGYIPTEDLIDIGGGQMLEETAANAFRVMQAHAAAQGVDISLISSYRTYEKQASIYNDKSRTSTAAKPGSSNHGWGRAIDVSRGIARDWIQRNGARFGWVWPEWAQRRGTESFEPWHFEFRGSRTRQPVSQTSSHPLLGS